MLKGTSFSQGDAYIENARLLCDCFAFSIRRYWIGNTRWTVIRRGKNMATNKWKLNKQTNKTLFLSLALPFSVAHESHLSYVMTILTTAAHIHFIAGISKDQYMRKGGTECLRRRKAREMKREGHKVDGGVLAQVTKWRQAFIFER